MFEFLLAMQAAGMITDWFGASQQRHLGKMGAQVEQAGIDDQIQTNRLDSEESSLAEMKKLRQTLGTQAAVFAARGTASNAGSAVGIMENSIGDFNADERIRKINEVQKEAQLKAQKTITSLHEMSDESQIGQSLAKRFFSTIPASSLAGTYFNKFGNNAPSTKTFGLTPFTG